MKKPFYIATGNPHKLKEIKSIFEEIWPSHSFLLQGITPEIKETEVTFLENALKKAFQVFHKLHSPVLAEDTGLIVDYLDGAPGLFSARFSSFNERDFESNIEKLLTFLKGVSFADRRAKFVTYAVIVFDESKYVWAKGTVEGFIIEDKKGVSGFGYDPIFLYPGFGRTFGELPERLKNKISHRRKAIEQVVEKFRRVYES